MAAATLVSLAGTAPISNRARKLHFDSLVFDAHLHAVNRYFYLGGDMGEKHADGQFDLPRAKEGGLNAMFLSLFISEEYYPQRYEAKQALRLLDFAIQSIARNHEVIELALNASDVERIHKSGKIAAVLDLEGGFDLDGNLAVLRSLYRLGFRVVQLPAHNYTNNFADSCCAPPKWHGLTEQGRAVIREMNRLGIVINVSHASDETLEQTIEVSSDPVVATHHGLRSINDIPRNMPDYLLKKLVAKGGVIGFQIGNDFHNRKFYEWSRQQKGPVGIFWSGPGAPYGGSSGIKPAGLGPLPAIEDIDKLVAQQYPSEYFGLDAPDSIKMSVDEWVEVVDRAIQLVGEDAVALGSDFDGGPTLPLGMKDVSDLPMITDAMLRRGYSEARIRKFLGENLLRVFRQITEKHR